MEVNLVDLWLPILASAAAVWICSALFWMVVGHHKKDFDKAPDENALIGAVRSLGLPPGSYAFPDCGSGKDMKSPEFKKKWEEGPLGMLHLWKPGMAMGKNMVLTFLVYVVISVFIAYIGHQALPKGSDFTKVFRLLGSAGVLGYCFSTLPQGIWFQDKPRAMAMKFIDGVVFGLVTGAIFGALWPSAA